MEKHDNEPQYLLPKLASSKKYSSNKNSTSRYPSRTKLKSCSPNLHTKTPSSPAPPAMDTFASITSSKTPKSQNSTPTSRTRSPTRTLLLTHWGGGPLLKSWSRWEQWFWLQIRMGTCSSFWPRLASNCGIVWKQITRSLRWIMPKMAGTSPLQARIIQSGSMTRKPRRHHIASRENWGIKLATTIASSQSNLSQIITRC